MDEFFKSFLPCPLAEVGHAAPTSKATLEMGSDTDAVLVNCSYLSPKILVLSKGSELLSLTITRAALIKGRRLESNLSVSPLR